MAIDLTTSRSRRALLISAMGGLAAIGATILRPLQASAIVQPGTFTNNENDDTVVMALSLSNGPGTGGGIGAYAESHSNVAVQGLSHSSVGVEGLSIGGRGGRFQGSKAQLKLVPSTARSHPLRGQRGDLFVDKSGRLWFCRGGTSWRRLA